MIQTSEQTLRHVVHVQAADSTEIVTLYLYPSPEREIVVEDDYQVKDRNLNVTKLAVL